MAERDSYARQFLFEYLAYFQFVLRINDRPQQAYGNRFNTELLEVFRCFHNVIAIERSDHASTRVNAFTDGARQVTRHIGFGIIQPPLKGALARALAQNKHILMAFGNNQSNLDGLAFHQSVGGNGRTVHNKVDLLEEGIRG